MSKKSNFRSLLIVYIFMVVFIVLIGLMGLINIRRVYLDPDDYNRVINTSIVALAFCIIGSVIIVIYMNRYIKRKLKGIRDFAGRVSEYDLTGDIDESGIDAFGKSLKMINDAQFKIRDTMVQLRSDIDNIGDSSKDTALAVRKTYEQIEALNVKIRGFIEQISDDYISDRKLWEIKQQLEESERELASISQYLSQVAVTADYQHEIADRFCQQLERFKL